MPLRSFATTVTFPKARSVWHALPHRSRLFSPSGLMLRMFSYLYDMDVVEEEAFMKWKEDVSQQFPGKGKALFQVGALDTISSCPLLIHSYFVTSAQGENVHNKPLLSCSKPVSDYLLILNPPWIVDLALLSLCRSISGWYY